MRRVLGLVVIGVLIAPMTFADTNVLSQNAVGYVKLAVDRGALVLASQDFLQIDGSDQTVSDVVGDQLPENSQVLVWSGLQFNEETYEKPTKNDPAAWTPDTNLLGPGIGFFMKCADTAPDASYDVFLLGEVPSEATQPTKDLWKMTGFTLMGYPFPANQWWTNTDMAATAVENDGLYLWNGAGYDESYFEKPTKNDPPVWTDPSVIITPGMGFFYQNNSGGDVMASETKPYSWP
jgi:hypothetical protein